MKAHKEAVGNFALRLQQLGSMVGRLVLLPGMSAGPLSPEQLPALKALLDRALVEVKVRQAGRGVLRVTVPAPLPAGLVKHVRRFGPPPPFPHPHLSQVFGQRGVVSKVLLASSDLGKISALDDEVTSLLRDFQVRAHYGPAVVAVCQLGRARCVCDVGSAAYSFPCPPLSLLAAGNLPPLRRPCKCPACR